MMQVVLGQRAMWRLGCILLARDGRHSQGDVCVWPMHIDDRGWLSSSQREAASSVQFVVENPPKLDR